MNEAIYNTYQDKLLSRVELSFLQLAAKHKIIGGQITRWRWDEPNISLTWKEDNMGKNLHVMLVENQFEVGIGIWDDDDRLSELIDTVEIADTDYALDKAFNRLVEILK